jgi:hypothetical protein
MKKAVKKQNADWIQEVLNPYSWNLLLKKRIR